ncbi:MAG: hypothetical protein IT371_05820 [Deltaproteobacteria bacterium]|nr:hypothetical protein [Deltaproteobacteria bacterium]
MIVSGSSQPHPSCARRSALRVGAVVALLAFAQTSAQAAPAGDAAPASKAGLVERTLAAGRSLAFRLFGLELRVGSRPVLHGLHEKLAEGALVAAEQPSFRSRNTLHAKLVGFESGLSAFWADLKQRPLLARARVLGQQVRFRAELALRVARFAARNQTYSEAVGEEAALLALQGLGRVDAPQSARVRQVFRAACQQAGAAFAPAFSAYGHALPEQEAAYKEAATKAGPTAFRWLPRLLFRAESSGRRLYSAAERAHYEERVRHLLTHASLEDIATVVAQDLGLRFTVTAEQMAAHIDRLVEPGHRARPDFSSFPQKADLSPEDRRGLRWAIRLANATWKAGQIHRAVWEKEIGVGPEYKRLPNYDRIQPGAGMYGQFDVALSRLFAKKLDESYHAYDAYDLSRAALFRQTYRDQLAQLTPLVGFRRARQEAQAAALSRVVFEVFLDVRTLKRGLAP